MSDDIDEIVDNLREPSAWIRIIFMVGFALVMYLVIAPIVLVLMIVQALFTVITGEANYNLRRFGGALGEYVLQILQFLTYNSHDKPFPFSDFPALDDDVGSDNEPDVKDSAAKEGAAKESSAKKAAAKKSTGKSESAKKKPAGKKTASKKTAAKKTAAKKAPASTSSGQAGTASDSDDKGDQDGADANKTD